MKGTMKKDWVPVTLLAVLLSLVSIALLWVGQQVRAERRAATEFRAEARAYMDQLANQKEQIAQMVSERVPPIFGHVALRTRFTIEQVQQSRGDSILLVGDSIIEGLFLDVVGRGVINGGMGGAGVDHANALLQQIVPGAMHSVVIAVGVNDTMRTSYRRAEDWERAFRKLTSRARMVARHGVVVCTVLPVEGGKPLGATYFDAAKIREVNQAIRRVAREQGATLVDGFAMFEPLLGKAEFTTDGVHLNAEGYAKLRAGLAKALR